MKGRRNRMTEGRTIVNSLMQDMCQLSFAQQDGLNKSKLLSSKGCDSIVYTEGERETSKSLSVDEQAFYKSLPEWNEEHYGT